MKYIIKRLSDDPYDFENVQRNIQEFNPYPELNPKLEKVAYCNREINVWTLEIKNIVDFVNKVGGRIILKSKKHLYYKQNGQLLPTIEIYDRQAEW